MLRTREIGGERQKNLLDRGEESLGTVAERVYLEIEETYSDQF